MPITLIATLVVAFTSVCFGMVPLFGRELLEAGLSAEAIALFRFGPALPIALAALPRRREALRPFAALAGAGLAGGLGWTAYLDVLDQVSVASAGVMYMTYPLFVVLLARLLVGQPITARAVAGAALVLAGALTANAHAVTGARDWLVLLASLPAPIGFALIIVFLATIGRELSTLQRWGATCVGQVAGLLPAALLSGGMLLPASAEGWAWIAGLAVVTATLPQILFVYASRIVSPSRTAAAGAAELPTMIAVGWLAFAENPGVREVLGASLIVAAIMVTPAVAASRRPVPQWLRPTAQRGPG